MNKEGTCNENWTEKTNVIQIEKQERRVNISVDGKALDQDKSSS